MVEPTTLSFYKRLKQRSVFRVGTVYIVVSWLLLQVGDVTFDEIGLPNGSQLTLMVILAIGFPIALILAWVFDVTPGGIVRTGSDDVIGDIQQLPRSRKKLIAITFSCVLILAFLAYFYGGVLVSSVIMRAPNTYFGDPVDQQIGVTTSADGTQIAFAISGQGKPLVYVLGWMTHLEKGFNSPIYDNERLLAMTSKQFRFVRYDGRGFGLSDRDVDDFSLAARVSDLKAVVDAAELNRFAILAASSGGPVAIAFIAQYPERVSGLVLGSAFASTSWASDEVMEEQNRFWDFAELAWNQPPVSDMFAGRILSPTGTGVEVAVLGAMLRRCCDGPDVADYFRVTGQFDVRSQAKQIKVPTLVMHARSDQATPLEGGKELASLIPGARFIIVEGGHREGTASSAETRRLALDFLEALP